MTRLAAADPLPHGATGPDRDGYRRSISVNPRRRCRTVEKSAPAMSCIPRTASVPKWAWRSIPDG